METPDIHSQLHPYLDGELSAEERSYFVEHLRTCAQCAEQVRAYSLLHQRLKTAFPSELVPESVRDHIRAAAVVAPPAKRLVPIISWRMAGVAACVVALLCSVWFFTHRSVPSSEDAEATEFVTDHTNAVTQGVASSIASADYTAVSEWVRETVGFTPTFSASESGGYELLGARSAHVAGKQVAVIRLKLRGEVVDVYEFPRGTHLSDELHRWDRNGYTVASFSQGALRFWIVGVLKEGELNSLVARLRDS
ncbi:MAG: zf-HC2 domain-containing protein [Bacteroidetes bacterium]|nr:zf-HC2 domain-containing protein [Bacteroidota bacterium]